MRICTVGHHRNRRQSGNYFFQKLETSPAQVSRNYAEPGGIPARSAKTLDEGIEPAWQPIEGTIKANDADIYIAFEDNFAVLADAVSSSDAVQAKNAANTIKSTADDYLADYPG